jgi:hypothetical protein
MSDEAAKYEALRREMEAEDRRARRPPPMTEAAKYAALRREDADAVAAAEGDVSHQDVLDNEPPSGWGE